MNLKQSLLGLALAGAIVLSSTPQVSAQQNRPVEPYYFTPKVLYSHTMMNDFEADGRFYGGFSQDPIYGNSVGTYKGDGKKSKNNFGGGLAIGYDFGAYSEYPVRLEAEYLIRSGVNSDFGFKQTSNLLGAADGYGRKMMGSSHKVESTIHSVFANAYLDFPTDTAFTPYIQAGLGGAYIDSKLQSNFSGFIGHDTGYWVTPPTDDGAGTVTPGVTNYNRHLSNAHTYGQQADWGFAWNAGAGFSYQLTDSLALDLNYRYSDFGEINIGTGGFIYSGLLKNPGFDPTKPAGGDNPANTEQTTGYSSTTGKMRLTAHEAILGLRFTGF